MKTIFAILALAATAAAQDGTVVNPTQGPPAIAYTNVYGYSGTTLTYLCSARSVLTSGARANTYVSISSATKANPGVFTSTAHGIPLSSRPMATISGATGTGWTAINATWIVTPIDANTFKVAAAATPSTYLDTSGYGTLAGTVVFTTTGPRLSMYEWAIKLYAYDGSSNLIWSGWLNGTPSQNQRCSDGTTTTLNQQ